MWTKQQIAKEIESYLEVLAGEMAPVHEFVEGYGEEAKVVIMDLWRERKVRLVPISDYRDFTAEQLANSIEGVEEVIGYVKWVG